MNKLLTILMLFVSAVSFAQVKDTLQNGEYAVITLGTNDYVKAIDVPTVVTSKYGVLKGDRVFYVEKESGLDTIASFGLNADDIVLLERGGEYAGTITVGLNDVRFGSWGSGAKPVVTGFTTVTGWAKRSNTDVYVKYVPTTITPEILTVNGVQYAKGRTPNANRYTPAYADYFHIDDIIAGTVSSVTNYSGTVAGTILITTSAAHGITSGNYVTLSLSPTTYNGSYTATVVSTTQFYVTKTYSATATGTVYNNNRINDTEIPVATADWTGAEAVIRTSNHMNFMRSTIASHSSNTIHFANADNLLLAAGYGYFIQNDLKTLDQFGEWYFNPITDSLYFYGNPSGYTVKISTVDKLIDVNTRDFITVKNLKLEGANSNAVATGYNAVATDLTIDNCEFDFNNRAIYGSIAPKLRITNNSIKRSSFMAVYQHWYSDATYMAYNTIDSTGLVMGSGKGEGDWYHGIAALITYSRHTYSTAAENTIIEYNSISNSGYMALDFSGDSAIVRNNYMNKYNLWKSDGGGIYYGGQNNFVNMKIEDNIVLNGSVSDESIGTALNSAAVAAYNIYIDYNSTGGILVDGNTSAHTYGAGIMIHMSDYVTVTNNTVYDCTTGVKFQELAGYSHPVRNITMNNNKIIAKKPHQENISMRSLNNDFALTGTIDYNIYAKPFSSDPLFITMVNTFAKTANTFSAYKTATSQDANSTVSSYIIQNDDSVRFYTNPTSTAVTYQLNDTLRDAAGTAYNTSVTVPAYGSKVLWNDDFESYTPKTLGIQTIGGTGASLTTRTAVPYTFTENGTIVAVVIYTTTGSNKINRVKLGVYDNTGSSGKPGTKLGETNIVQAIDYAGWERVNLTQPLNVTNGQTVWLAWIHEKTISTYYSVGTPGYAWTTGNTWADGLPSTYGTSTQNNSLFSMYFIYK